MTHLRRHLGVLPRYAATLKLIFNADALFLVADVVLRYPLKMRTMILAGGACIGE